MRRVRSTSDLEECRLLWQQLMPEELVSDLWDVRCCFHSQYGHRPHFVVAEDNGRVEGFLPLSWNQETGQYNYFPGETWEGKTWLEQNMIIADNRETLNAMLTSLDKPYSLRYLKNNRCWSRNDEQVDEVGYLFLPETYGYDADRYLDSFSHKSAKKLRKEVATWDCHTIEWRYNQPDDFDELCRMNRERFGRLSYFDDQRFLESFRSLTSYLHDRRWLRMATIIVDGEVAAIDLGSLYSGMLTMLAGGTNSRFPGIAKLINMHHIQFACENRLDSVDFLCGDFNWKTFFHLTPAPLYLLEGTPATTEADDFVRPAFLRRPAGWGIMRRAPYA
jgi:hypothetical protein